MKALLNAQRRLLCLASLVGPLKPHLQLFAAEKPALKLAKTYSKKLSLDDYLVSEKYDGVRVYWTGQLFLTRAGNLIEPPSWWSQGLSDITFDGELWIERGAFSELNGLLKRSKASDEQWRRVMFLVFDLPNYKSGFEERYATLDRLMEKMNSPNIKLVVQASFSNHEELMQHLDSVIDGGGEGLMLQHKTSPYTAGRHAGLYKLKRWQDAEAVVVGNTDGRGKYLGMMGALIVEMPDGTRFRIGTGFTDAERSNPPKPGAVVTYRYAGKSKKGVPRFASFLRVRERE